MSEKNDEVLFIQNAEFLQHQQKSYVQSRDSVPEDWRNLLSSYDDTQNDVLESNDCIPRFNKSIFHTVYYTTSDGICTQDENPKYKELEYADARINPLENEGNIASLSEIKEKDNQYCNTIEVEFAHIRNTSEREWLYSRFEQRGEIEKSKKLEIMQNLIKAERFEQFLHKKFVGAKRFSLEGGESMIPGIYCLAHRISELGSDKLMIGMSHRGRLNTLVNLLKKPYHVMLYEFQGGILHDSSTSGDVKYHMGYKNTLEFNDGNSLEIELFSNPSHLEAVNTVVLGGAKAAQDRDISVVPLLIHGDAAFAGQGIVYETIAMGNIDGYSIDGTIHIVVNNQIGFTAVPNEGRSTRYCSDIVKGFEIPVLHVNGNDPEAMVFACEIAAEYRDKFQKDFMIDMVCYRKYGHNESDEPTFTNPSMYQKISNMQSSTSEYSMYLEKSGVMTSVEYQIKCDEFLNVMNDALEKSKSWKPDIIGTDVVEEIKINTSVTQNVVDVVQNAITGIPENFTVHKKLKKLMDGRLKALSGESKFDWGAGEMLAFGAILHDGMNIRISGQDSQRGTFSHRHAVLHDNKTDAQFMPLSLVNHDARCVVLNSLLSEYGVMGFEYGYDLNSENSLVIWEAQFGDFVNGAQIIIDQFLSSSEQKWRENCGLVLLLPHGYEGQGPEHTSARIERFLQMCAQENMYVMNFTTPANYFHALRLHALRACKKPMVVFTPKSLLRHKSATSELQDFMHGEFHPVISDDVKNGKKLIFCSGKIYYDLLEHKTKSDIVDVALVRLEQIYPFPENAMREILHENSSAQILWCQEESRNMGAWSYICMKFLDIFDIKINYIGRTESASPACGYMSQHQDEQNEIILSAFAL